MEQFSLVIAVVSTGVALAGIALATALYLRRREREPLLALGGIHAVLSRKYYVDELYEGLIVRRFFYGTFARSLDWIDHNIVDGTVEATGWVFRNVGRAVARVQTGQVQGYGAMVALGSILIIAGYLVFG